MADNYELTEQQKKELEGVIKDQMNRMGEVFSQCWESDDFKEAFMKDPKAIFFVFGVNYNEEKEYVVIDSPDKTIVHVLPHDGIKSAVDGFGQMLAKKVEDLDDKGGRQILLDGWKYEIYQNTPDKFYIAIPHSPDNLSPEELEMVNGGCFFLAFVFIIESVALGSTVAVLEEVAAWSIAVAISVGVAVVLIEGWSFVASVSAAVTANMEAVGEFITVDATHINTAANVVTN